jgi:hypothetical protein
MRATLPVKENFTGAVTSACQHPRLAPNQFHGEANPFGLR